MFTGKRPTDEIFRDGMNLHNFVNKAIGDQVMAIVDESAWYREESVSKEKDDIGTKPVLPHSRGSPRISPELRFTFSSSSFGLS
ncbi:hypothetical protein ACET3Z_007456 [Daucus carota]